MPEGYRETGLEGVRPTPIYISRRSVFYRSLNGLIAGRRGPASGADAQSGRQRRCRKGPYRSRPGGHSRAQGQLGADAKVGLAR